MKPLIYVAGPYTHPDPVLNVRRACAVADLLVEIGAALIVPHLSIVWHLVSPQDIDEWYQRDLDILEHCDALVRFHGESTGADREVAHARRPGLETWSLVRGHDDVLGHSLPLWVAEFTETSAS